MMKLVVSTTHDVNVNVNVNIPQLADLLAVLGGSTIAETLQRIEDKMNDFDAKLDRLEASVNAFSEREAKEDEETVLTKAENAKLKQELADLQALREADKITPEQDARLEAILKRIDDSNKISSEVLPPVEPPADGDVTVDEVPAE